MNCCHCKNECSDLDRCVRCKGPLCEACMVWKSYDGYYRVGCIADYDSRGIVRFYYMKCMTL